MRNLLLIFALLPSLVGIAAPAADTSLFLGKYAAIAKQEMKAHGIPASIKMAQSIVESGWGTSELAVNSNNYFGLKCWSDQDCTSTTYLMQDDDFDTEGNLTYSTFMAFASPEESFKMHSLFITSKMDRYGSLFELAQNDYKGWAKGLKKAGYASNPQYAEKLIQIIEEYQLYKLDEEVMRNSSPTPSNTIALDQLAQVATPANPVRDADIGVANEHGSFGSESIVDYQSENPSHPNTTTIDQFPTAPENPKETEVPVALEIIPELPETTTTPTPAVGSYGSQDVSKYIPDEFKELFEENETEKGSTDIQKLKEIPNKEMISGSLKPR